MFQFLVFVTNLFLLLPWWGAVGVLVGIAVGLWAFAHYFVYRFQREVAQAVQAQGEPLANALVTVHSVRPAQPPTTPSLLDDSDDEFDDADEEQFDPNTDGMFAPDGFSYFWIETTIAPQESQTAWDPSMLALVPADFEPESEFEFCGQTALLHTVEVCRNGQFKPQGAQNVTGAQRLRLLFAVPDDVRQAKFSYHFTYFGSVTFPISAQRIMA